MGQGESRAELLLRFGLLKRELRELELRLDLGLDRRDPAVPPGVAPALLSLVAEHSADLISVHAADGDYVYASPNAERFFGWQPRELEGHSAYEFFHPDDVQRVAQDHAKQGRDAHVGDIRYRLRTPSGDYKWVESRSVATQDGSFIVVITRDVQREQELIAELERLSRFDDLTGLLNRRGLEEVLGHEIDRNGRYGTPVSVVLLDIDDFKAINDGQGHDAGDQTLRAVSAVVVDKKRTCDAAGRWGGDEFLIVLPDTDPIRAVAFAERLRSAARSALPVTLSLGIGGARPKDSIRDLVLRADAALYAVKTRGGDGVVATPTPPAMQLAGH